MDKLTLKKNILALIQAFKADGHSIEVAGIIPLYPDLQTSSYMLQIYSSWLNTLPSNRIAIQAVVDKLYQLLPPNALRYIHGIEICNLLTRLHCTTDDLIINELRYQPAATTYNYLDN
jgi:hypothetical protein